MQDVQGGRVTVIAYPSESNPQKLRILQAPPLSAKGNVKEKDKGSSFIGILVLALLLLLTVYLLMGG